MEGKFYIKKFIRDDGATLELDGVKILLAEENAFLQRADPNTTTIEFTEADGGEMLSQRLTTVEQTINGLLLAKDNDYWTLANKMIGFFKIRHFFKIIYIKKSGEMFAVSNAWISTALQIVPTPYEQYANWSIGLTAGNDFWREYTEDESGHETYAHSVEIPLLASAMGGENWDDVGLVADEVGEDWLNGSGGIQSIMIDSTATVYPVWTVVGPCVNPRLQNNTTDSQAEYNGTVAAGQTLIVDFETGEAKLDGALVTRLVRGIVSCVPGDNLIGFNSDGGATDTSTLSWNNIIG